MDITKLNNYTTLFVIGLIALVSFIPLIISYVYANKETSVAGELPKNLSAKFSKTGWLWVIGLVIGAISVFTAYKNQASSPVVYEVEFYFWFAPLAIIANGVVNIVLTKKYIKEADKKAGIQ